MAIINIENDMGNFSNLFSLTVEMEHSTGLKDVLNANFSVSFK